MQKFKENDDLEQKVINAFLPLMNELFLDRTAFFNGAYVARPLGGVLYDLNRAPLANNIQRDYFITSFFAIFQLFTRPSTFEFYLDVFRAIFGSSVDITFTVVGPAHLQINIEVLEAALDNLVARRIEGGAYVYYDLITADGDEIMAQTQQGPKSQSEIDALMKEITPQGIFVETTLVI